MSSDEWTTARRVVVCPDTAGVVAVVARRLVAKLTQLTQQKQIVHVAVTGGGAGIGVLRAVAAHPARTNIAWDRVHFWWSDERFVPASDAERNAGQAHTALLDHVPVPSENIHAMAASDAGLTAEEGADVYAAELARFAPEDAEEGARWPAFDICLLGVGPDAHIASLFPDRAEILITDRAAVPVYDSPKPPPVRITLTRPVINTAKRVWLVLTGAEKASALGLALAGASYASVPAAGAKGTRKTVFYVDADAASEVPAELIDPE